MESSSCWSNLTCWKFHKGAFSKCHCPLPSDDIVVVVPEVNSKQLLQEVAQEDLQQVSLSITRGVTVKYICSTVLLLIYLYVRINNNNNNV